MPRARCLLLVLALGTLATACGGGPVLPPPTPLLLSLAPALPAVLEVGDVVETSVHAVDPEGLACDVVLLNPPPGCVFDAARAEPSFSGRRLRWTVPNNAVGTHRLSFFARSLLGTPLNPSNVTKRSARLSVDVRVQAASAERGGTEPRRVQIGDVTGDGVLDVVVAASQADVLSVQDAGAVEVWAGGAAPSSVPTAELRVPGAAPGDRLGDAAGQPLQLADVTGDGVLDVVVGAAFRDLPGAVDAGAVYVWRGGAGLVGTPLPLAELVRPTPRAADGTFTVPGGATFAGLSFTVVDVSGDGVRDVLVQEPDADGSPPAADVGAVLVAFGGPSLTGSPAVELVQPFSNQTGARVGDPKEGGLLVVGDVTGDGTPELLCAAPHGTVTGQADQGVVLAWRARPGLTGAVPRRLSAPEIAPGALLGRSAGVRLADVTGDGVLDVIAASTTFGSGPSAEMGEVVVWAGSSTMFGAAGTLVGTAALLPALVNFPAHLTEGAGGLRIGDVTGDGVLDVVANAPAEDGARGAIYVWRGGAGLAGNQVLPLVRMAVPGATADDRLATATDTLRLADVTGDGVLDVVAAAILADVAGVVDAGEMYVWAGAPTPAPTPTATLRLSDPHVVDQLAQAGGGVIAIELLDVTDDGVLDVLAAAPFAQVGAVGGQGCIGIWKGGPGLTGVRTDDARLVAPAGAPFSHLGGSPGRSMLFADLDGDGRQEAIAFGNDGSAQIWQLPPALSGFVVPAESVALGALARVGHPHALLGDANRDGVLDLVVAVPSGAEPGGALHAAAGGSPLPGGTTSLVVPGANADAHLGAAAGHAVLLADVTGDDQPDLVSAAPFMDAGGRTPFAGEIEVFEVSAGFGAPVLFSLRRSTPRTDDFLGL